MSDQVKYPSIAVNVYNLLGHMTENRRHKKPHADFMLFLSSETQPNSFRINLVAQDGDKPSVMIDAICFTFNPEGKVTAVKLENGKGQKVTPPPEARGNFEKTTHHFLGGSRVLISMMP